MDPVTLAAVSLGTTAAGGGISALGSIMGGQAAAKAATYRAGIAQVNQQIALQNEAYQIRAGETRAYESGLSERFRMGQITAAQGASNLGVYSGSAPQVRAGQTGIAQFEQGIIRENAGRLAYGEAVKATGAGAEAGLETIAAETAKTAGGLGATTSILGAATSVSSKWLQGQSGGLFPGGSQPSSDIVNLQE